ncbi:hypothetical protein, partial [Ralstonia pseudosolanacearum]|uniref:hypothetical protein n=1 Tax=Ralstonia pseudosolanacearum TaxID=1310165 RepID=UPI001E4563C9
LPGKSRESTQSAGLFTALSVWTVARKRQLAAWRGGFMQQRPWALHCGWPAISQLYWQSQFPPVLCWFAKVVTRKALQPSLAGSFSVMPRSVGSSAQRTTAAFRCDLQTPADY